MEKRHRYNYRTDTKTKRFEIQSSLISNKSRLQKFLQMHNKLKQIMKEKKEQLLQKNSYHQKTVEATGK